MTSWEGVVKLENLEQKKNPGSFERSNKNSGGGGGRVQ